jgi:hypothetical protein
MEEKMKEQKNRKDYWLHEVKKNVEFIKNFIDRFKGYYC